MTFPNTIKKSRLGQELNLRVLSYKFVNLSIACLRNSVYLLVETEEFEKIL